MFWTEAQQVAQQALKTKALLPIGTEPQIINQHGIDFFIHLKSVNNAQAKFAPKPSGFNPFLPYEQSMYVADAGHEHVCLLNKFPVLSPHLLICSKQFVQQTQPLTVSDFAAWILGFESDNDLGFYNGGTIAGASQPHRHMQLIKTQLPTEPAIVKAQLPFVHQLYRYQSLDPQQLWHDYNHGMDKLHCADTSQCKPYNLLLTKRWMLIIPRSRNNVEGIFANGINYSGHFLIAKPEQIIWLKQYGFMAFLAQCSQPI